MNHCLLIVMALLALVSSSPSCANVSSCFIKHLFDFSYPQENVYSIAFNNDLTSLDNIVLGYGDFNNDLHADYIAVNPDTNDLLIFFYRSEDSEYFKEGEYTLQFIQTSFEGCNPLSAYLYDVDLGDKNLLDITIWGEYDNSTNCLFPLIQTELGQFETPLPPLNFQETTQPIIFQSSAMQGSTFLLLYDQLSEARKVLYFSLGNYTTNNWTALFQQSNQNIPFSNQHWNSFIDLTQDCSPEIVITNQRGEIEFWVWFSQINKYALSKIVNVQKDLSIKAIKALSFQDVDYDGEQELIIGNQSSFMIYGSTLQQGDEFCQQGKTTIGLDFHNPITVPLPENCTLNQQNIQFGDINSDGYPDLLFTCYSSVTETTRLVILENDFNRNGGSFSNFQQYQTKVDLLIDITQIDVTRVSLFDILENGIIDIIVTVNDNRTVVLYNNYLYQNYFYIKGYATNGVTSAAGTQIPGATFYYLNSLGNSQRTANYIQMFQTAYGAVPAPYILTGLGKANNYVEQFTIGRLGKAKSWSPIIPNSQLAVYSGSEPQSWSIKIFIMPTDSLVYVLIVCIVILTILGIVLAVLKCRNKKKEDILYKSLNDM